MKKMMLLIAVLALATTVTACGSRCKSCDEPAYKDGYCKYHYALNTAQDLVDDAAQGALDALFG